MEKYFHVVGTNFGLGKLNCMFSISKSAHHANKHVK